MLEQADRFSFQSWGASLLIHSVVVACALSFVAHVKPVLQQDAFQWDVALVHTASPIAPSAPAQMAAASERAVVSAIPAAQAGRSAEPIEPRVALQEQPHMTQSEVEPTKAVQRTIEQVPVMPHSSESKSQIGQPRVEPVERQVTEVVPMKPEPVEPPSPNIETRSHEAVQEKKPEPEPRPHAEPLVARSQPAAPAEKTDSHRAQREFLSHEHTGPLNAQMSEATSPPASETDTGPSTAPQISSERAPAAESSPAAPQGAPVDAPVQVAKVAPSGPAPKADHRWLAESLWRRVAELKRYPASARLHGLEGKVVLKAVIRSNGQLAEVSVQKSSGHTILDAAAMDAVREACPLEMKQPITKAEIVVSLPIVYSLSN